MPGKLECQITVTRENSDEGHFELTTRHQDTVITNPEENDDNSFLEDNMDEENILDCKAEGIPAPDLSWWSLDDEDNLHLINEDFVDTLPLEIVPDTGVQIATERFYLEEVDPGAYTCIVKRRSGSQKILRMEIYENKTWSFEEEIVEDISDDEGLDEWITEELLWILVSVNITILLLLTLCMLVSGLRICQRRGHRRRRQNNFLSNKINNNMFQNGNHKQDSLPRRERSIKRKAPSPIAVDELFLSF